MRSSVPFTILSGSAPLERAVDGVVEGAAAREQGHRELYRAGLSDLGPRRLDRRLDGVLDASVEVDERPIAVLFTGRPHASFDGSRLAVYEQMVRLGAVCRPGFDQRTTCALCAREARACHAVFAKLGLSAGDDPSAFGAVNVLALAAHATLCVEPTSDTLVRSHFYAAALMGCIPIIFDTYTPMPDPFRTDRAPFETRWAWRHLPPQARALPGGAVASGKLNYSAFTRRVQVGPPKRRGERRPHSAVEPLVPPTLAADLLELARAPTRRPELRRTQRALALAAPLLHYASRTACPSADDPPCDAASMLMLHMRALTLADRKDTQRASSRQHD